ncbi:ARP2 3 complex 21 kDa subunit [Tilletiopsis washingtonensis]|uniref:Actin-related protein 2/3 complex subunit 3 n=1 Tax=Tilletiopsis washingtonensis TaxID=58919 RepID=A0A316Z326_9BASI|nr:ARP2 3 complex 21 kDa subunit [Tilletiopsis washingtonensis]PWN95786.1 ARP2 3 complex 21 kDa subunit [Tilletiopsis washingtonensis]
MPAYHSAYNDADVGAIASMSLLPIRTRVRGPAPPLADADAMDIVDEAIDLFRANCLFRNFEIKGGADRLLIYLILFISDCLSRIAGARVPMSQNEASKQLQSLSVDNFSLPGDASFPLNNLYQPPASRAEAEHLRSYLTQLRTELAQRLVEKVYIDGKPSKWWLSFTKRRFMGKSL